MSLTTALKFVLRWEGGYANHPNDPGGATNKGVTQRVYDAWRLRAGRSKRAVLLISEDEVHDIYEGDYWLAARCDQMAEPLDLVQFDTAVNMGVGRAIRFLQAAVEVQADGDFGPATLSAVQSADPRRVAQLYCDIRERYYHSLATQNPKLAVFLKGWLNRLNDLRATVSKT